MERLDVVEVVDVVHVCERDVAVDDGRERGQEVLVGGADGLEGGRVVDLGGASGELQRRVGLSS